MGYNICLERISTRNYREMLKKQNLLPGRRILLQNIDKNFAIFESRGIKNVFELKHSLSSPRKIALFSAGSHIPEDYLVILKREIGSLDQKPVPLANFPGVEASLIEKLSGEDIRTSKDYFVSNASPADELFCLSDLVRINGVGPAAAKAFCDAGYRSVEDVAAADASVMLERVSAANKIKQYYKAGLGIKDMQFCIDFAQLLITSF